MEIHVKSEAETVQTARRFASEIQPGDLILLQGNLGAGKSVFTRALIRELSENDSLEVPSPTFTLVQTYDAEIGTIWHFDLYRLEDAEEIFELGWEDALNDALVIVEWPERLGEFRPKAYLDIGLMSVENDPLARMIQIKRVE